MSEGKRESFGSRLGFIFLSAGCAVGLGNVWRFPTIAGRYGGAIFVIIYLVFLLLLAAPIMVMEFSVGRAAQLSIIGQFGALEPKGSRWHIWSPIAAAGNCILMAFYTVVTGWMVAYFWRYLTGAMEHLTTTDLVSGEFGAMLSDPRELMLWMGVSIAIGAGTCCIGLKNGVERITKMMMSGLLIIMFVLAARAITLPGAGEGLDFYFKPNIDRFIESGPISVIYAALSQAFFTLSLGIGSMAIFGSYIGRDRRLTGEALTVAALDTLIAICAGLIIFPTCFSFGVEPNVGPGLILVTLPNMFAQMDGGRLWGTLFFLFMSFAALSTVIAVFENIIANLMDGLGWSRLRSSIVCFAAIFVLATPCALSFNVLSWFEPLGAGTGVLDLEDFILSNNMLPIGSVIYLLFCCSRKGWGWDNFIAEADAGSGLRFPKALRGYLTWVVPIIMIIVIVMGYVDMFVK